MCLHWPYPQRKHGMSSEPEKSELVVKANKLIEASYRLTLVEQQLVLCAISEARDRQQGLSASSSVSIEARAFAEQFGLDPNGVYTQLKEASSTLFARQIVIHDKHPKTGKPRVVKTRWVSDVAYTEGAGIVELTFAPKVIPLITRLEQEFTSYRIERIGKMSSAHAVRIYELLLQYLTIGERKFSIIELKQTLGIANEYAGINDFKKRVLDVAQAQINEHSDLIISYSQKKKGRIVSDIVFRIQSKDAVMKKPKKPTQLGLDGIEPARKSKDPAVLAEREKALAAARVT